MQAEFKIMRDGTWHHQGSPIKREALAKLFADRALKIDEDGNYWLQTPYEKYPVDVEDVPFVITRYDDRGGDIYLTTNMDDTITLGADHPLQLRNGVPYVKVRNGLYARISRPVFYHWAQEYGTHITSQGITFSLGETDEHS